MYVPLLFAYNSAMPPRRKLTPIQVLDRLQLRLEKRMEALQRVKLDGYAMVISELETELDYLRRANAVSGGVILQRSSGVNPVCFAMRASIPGPSSSESLNAQV
jgi:hypothetical protein